MVSPFSYWVRLFALSFFVAQYLIVVLFLVLEPQWKNPGTAWKENLW